MRREMPRPCRGPSSSVFRIRRSNVPCSSSARGAIAISYRLPIGAYAALLSNVNRNRRGGSPAPTAPLPSLLRAQRDVEAQHHFLVLLDVAQVDLEVAHRLHHVLLPVLDL